VSSPSVTAPLKHAGSLFAFALDTGRASVRLPFQLREFLQQAWFVASVTIIPTALVAIPFGAVIALQVGGLIKQFGAQAFTGSAAVLAVVREASPIATALLIAGAGGSAICADLGARKIREELDDAGRVLPERVRQRGRGDGRLRLQRGPAGRHAG
jgi:phospholipid/cholesterol/gamma-HCH transport system permease protein